MWRARSLYLGKGFIMVAAVANTAIFCQTQQPWTPSKCLGAIYRSLSILPRAFPIKGNDSSGVRVYFLRRRWGRF